MVRGVQVREAGRWIFVDFLWHTKLKNKMYILDVFQQIRCGEISWKIQRNSQILGTLETTYLMEINKVELISEGHGKKNIYTEMR